MLYPLDFDDPNDSQVDKPTSVTETEKDHNDDDEQHHNNVGSESLKTTSH